MIKRTTIIFIVTLYSLCNFAQDLIDKDTVSIKSGNLRLKALLWRPAGKGPFATVIFCHGNYASDDTVHNAIAEASVNGPLFARRGYIYLALFRRGVGLSKDQGLNCANIMDSAFKKNGQEGRNEVQLQQLETTQLQDMLAGINYMRKRKDTDTSRMAIIGHSFGGSLTLLVAEKQPFLKAVVVFSPAGYSWNLSSRLRTKLISVVRNINVPIMILHAQNDYSVNPGYSLDSILNQLHKPHLLKIYPGFGNSTDEGHNMIFLNTKIWEGDVFRFLENNLGT
jgi:dienelactone hydrolase